MEAAADRQGTEAVTEGASGKVMGLGVISMETHYAKIKGKMKGCRGWRAGDNPYKQSHLLTT